MTNLLWVLALSLGTSFLCSILEAILLSITRSYAETLAEEGHRAGRILKRFQKKIDEPIAAILTLNTVAHTVGAALGGALALEVFGNNWVGLFSAVLTVLILLFSEILPKTIGATFWQTLAPAAAYVLQGMVIVMKPAIVPLSWVNRLIGPRQTERPTVSRAELEVLARIGRREGTLDEAEWKVVTNVINLDQVSVAEVMTPRTDMVAISVDATVDEAKALMLDRGHLRLPVYEGNLDQVTGILLARDLWDADRRGEVHIEGLVRPAVFAPVSKAVEDLIPELRSQRMKMAIIVDEFGGTAGLATLEDLIEEIIGEIQDEHEGDEPADFRTLDDGRVRIWGGVPVRQVNERLGLTLPEDQHDTVGGHVFGELNRIGRVEDTVDVGEGILRIARMRGRRIEFLDYEPRDESA